MYNQTKLIGIKTLGQPTNDTHPHIIKKGEVTPLITKFEYDNRRCNLVDAIRNYSFKNNLKSTNHLIIVPAASTQYMSAKIPYFFRQNTEFLYLTGCLEPDCCAVLTITDQHFFTTLFTRDKDNNAEIWDGPRTHAEDAADFFGVNQSLPISGLENFVTSFMNSMGHMNLWYDYLTPVQHYVHSIVEKFMLETGNKSCENPKLLIQQLRIYKSPAEIALMQKSCDIAGEAFIETIKHSIPGMVESQLNAKFDYECKLMGAENLAYPPIIAGGNRTCIIHYVNNNQIVKNGDLVLMDAGCEYHGYCSDISRTWPISGKFTPEQRTIYKIVYDVNLELIEMCNKFPTLDYLFETMLYSVGKKLQHIGLLPKQESTFYLMKISNQLCPHHSSHYLGMDVHDTPTLKRNIEMKPGMVITIEPGIYINENNMLLPANYRGIGIRIEDDILITENGPVLLSYKCPKHIDDIERLASENKQLHW